MRQMSQRKGILALPCGKPMCGQPLARCAIHLYAEGARCRGNQVYRYAALGINAKGGACGLLVREVGNAINAQQVK